MFCKYCGKDLGDTKEEICEDCKKKNENIDSKETSSNTDNATFNENEKNETVVEAEVIDENANSSDSSNEDKRKSKLAAGLFGIFLGAFGVHNFYLGYEGKAIAQLLITVLSCGIFAFASAIWGLIEGILILSGEIDKDGKGNFLKNDM